LGSVSGFHSILIAEYFCAGGGGARVPSGVLREARAILESLLEDFSALPGIRVLTLRRRGGAPGGDDALVAAVRQALREADAALIVAPERGGALLRLTRALESSGAVNLGASSRAVRIASDKWLTHRALAQAGVPRPRAALAPALRLGLTNAGLRAVANAAAACARGSGWIVKPRDGYGCLGARAVPPAPGNGRAALRALAGAVRSAAAHTHLRNVLIEEQCLGIDASVCMVGDGRRAVPLCLNAQRVARRAEPGGSETLEYAGGATPLDHPRRRAALALARRAAEAIPGLRGYFGVDLILEARRARVVEINPRLTSSYLGLRRVASRNPAAWLLEAARRRLPRGVRLRGRVEFSFACPTSSAGTSAAST
jgi:hypothetical protein